MHTGLPSSAKNFDNSRQFAAWLGVVPRQHSSGGKPTLLGAHFSDRGRLFQADRGRRFSAIVDARGSRASEVFNVSQSSTISLKRDVDGPLSMRP